FQYFVVVIAVCYTAFSFSKPDYIIASYRLEHEELKEDDLYYLTYELSLDAAPLVLPIAANKDNYLDRIENATNAMDFREFNLSGYLARKESEKY
ncbi:MAG: putative rane protein, partial [Herbinix sp.]|nr:putative rane protein [Herbinix sp.]